MAPVVIGSSPLDCFSTRPATAKRFPAPKTLALLLRRAPCCFFARPAGIFIVLPVGRASLLVGHPPLPGRKPKNPAGNTAEAAGNKIYQQGGKFSGRTTFLPAGRVFGRLGSLFLRLGTKKLRRIRSFLADTITFRL